MNPAHRSNAAAFAVVYLRPMPTSGRRTTSWCLKTSTLTAATTKSRWLSSSSMVSLYDKCFYDKNHCILCSHSCWQAWIKEDICAASDTMQSTLCFKHIQMDDYIKFISHFGPSLKWMACWNSNKTTKHISKLLIIMDKAFIHICIINYSATWKAQEQKESEETDIQVTVSAIKWVSTCDCNQKWLTPLSLAVF